MVSHKLTKGPAEDVIGRSKQHQRAYKGNTDPKAHLLRPLAEGTPTQGFQSVIEQMPAIQQGDRHQIDESHRDRQDGRKMEKGEYANFGDLTRHMGDADRAGDVIGRLTS